MNFSGGWFDEIPTGWRALKIRRLCRVRRGASPRPIDDPIYFDQNGSHGWVRISDVTSSNRTLWGTEQRLSQLGKSLSVEIKPGELFLSIAGSVGKPIIAGIPCCIHDGFVYFEGLEALPEFLYYIFISGRPYAGLGKLGTQLNLNTDTVSDIYVPLPQRPEQRGIVDFLDEQTVQIDELIAKKQRLIELLDERRTSLISQVVTQGIDPGVPMKESGVPWLARVPAHWQVKRLGRFCYLQRGHDLPDQEREPGKVPIVSSAGVSGSHIRAAAKGPAVVTGRYGSIGQVFYLDGPYWPLNTTLYSVSLFGNDARYAKFMLEHLPLASDSEKSAVPGVNRNYLHTLKVVCPPLDEQVRIAELCLATGSEFARLAEAVQHAIDLLREYRSALITAAVTGKLDIRDHEKKMEALS